MQAKWSCPTCTYENWPKSTKCAMCGYVPNNSARSQASGLILPSPECDVGIGSAQEERLVELLARVVENERKTVPRTRHIVHLLKRSLRQPHISRYRYKIGSIIHEPISQSPNNCEYERKMRRLRRQADWNWLNACIGIIEGDVNPVEAYLSSGGDPARTLTPSEVAILNRSSAFDVGHTLVHLAIR